MPTTTKKILGFTLIEILVVMAIMAILAAIGIGAFGGVQSKARDAQRKSDLAAFARAVEMFYNDNGRYPVIGSEADMGTAYDHSGSGIVWGQKWEVNGVLYMNQIPADPKITNYRFIPLRIDGSTITAVGTTANKPNGYYIFAHLENEEDAKVARAANGNPGYYDLSSPGGIANRNSCNLEGCNYVLRSPNAPVLPVTPY